MRSVWRGDKYVFGVMSATLNGHRLWLGRKNSKVIKKLINSSSLERAGSESDGKELRANRQLLFHVDVLWKITKEEEEIPLLIILNWKDPKDNVDKDLECSSFKWSTSDTVDYSMIKGMAEGVLVSVSEVFRNDALNLIEECVSVIKANYPVEPFTQSFNWT